MSAIEPMPTAKNHRGSRFRSMSLNSWLLASNAAFFALSAFALVASIAVFLLTRANDRAKDRELRRYQLEAAETVALANATAETAKADAGKAHEAGARANERAAHLEKEVGDIKPQVKSLMPIALDKTQIEAISSAKPPEGAGYIRIGIDTSANLMRNYARELTEAFRAAGWEVINAEIMGLGNAPRSGIAVKTNKFGPSSGQSAVMTALKSANIKFDNQNVVIPRAPEAARPAYMPPLPIIPGDGPNDVQIVIANPSPNQ